MALLKLDELVAALGIGGRVKAPSGGKEKAAAVAEEFGWRCLEAQEVRKRGSHL